MTIQIAFEVPMMLDDGEGNFFYLDADEVKDVAPDLAGKSLILRTYDDTETSIELTVPGCPHKLLVTREDLRRALDMIDRATVGLAA